MSGFVHRDGCGCDVCSPGSSPPSSDCSSLDWDATSLVDRLRNVADGASSAFDDAPKQFEGVLSAASDYLGEAANEIERLQKELDSAMWLTERQGTILTNTVNAIRGNPPDLVAWSHHDVAELATELKAENDRLRESLRGVKAQLDWQREPPDSPGEWLWLCQWTCGCMMKVGVAWVPERDETPRQMDCVLPCGLSLSWEGQVRDGVGIDEVVAWAKIRLPPREWREGEAHRTRR